MDDYSDYDGLGLAELVRTKEATPAELVEAAIERIERHNPALNAVVYKGYEDARRWAKGDLPGYTAVLARQTHRNEVVVILSNNQASDVSEMRRDILYALKKD